MDDHAIRQRLKQYLEAFYTKDFHLIFEYLYEPDVIEFRNRFIDLAVKMEEFGETEELLHRIKLVSIQSLKALSTKEFLVKILNLIHLEITNKIDLEKMLNELKITEIDNTQYITNIKYKFPYHSLGGWNVIESQDSMIYSDGQWKLLYKSNLSIVFDRLSSEINLFKERKSNDRLDLIEHEGDLSRYKLIGYKNLEGEVVFEARFKDAGEFSEGLAYIQVIKRYGYLNLKGEIAIKPRFIKAETFSEKRAGVLIGNDGKELWGFIDRRGNIKIKPQFHSVSSFNEGLCAVEKDGKWGYINKKGEVIISFRFSQGSDFSFGEAYVEIVDSKGVNVELTIDKKGNVLE